MEIFRNRKPNFSKLHSFGFSKNGAQYVYNTVIADGQFEMSILISDSGGIDTKVFDMESMEEYILHRTSGAAGAFIGLVRDEHDCVLREIADECFEVDVFKSDYAKQLVTYVRDAYDDELEFLWAKFPNNAIWRRKDTAKWYGALLTISKRKLGIESDEIVEVVDLRLEPEKLEALIDGKKYYPGYHMNKKHWYTVILDGSVAVDELCYRIDESYQLAIK